MESLIATSRRLISKIQTTTFRYLYDKINWNDRLIMIKGSRGVGKTTMLLQRLSLEFGPTSTALYASCDNLWFSDNRIIDLASYHYDHGGTHLYLDEIHRYNGNWQQELKNIYDSFPDYHVVFTGSSMIHLDSALADLSRRCLHYHLQGLSFREYLKFENIADFNAVDLPTILNSNHQVEWNIAANTPSKILFHFKNYLGHSYYPFYNSGSTGEYYAHIERIIDTTLNQDIPSVDNIEIETIHKLSKLLYVMSTQVPFTLNVQSLSQKIQVSRNTIIKMFDLLDKGGIIRCIHSGWRSPRSVAKPEKILFNNVDIMASLSSLNDIGTVRETFAASMLANQHKIFEPPTGDFLVDEKYILEIGGKTKNHSQVADITDSYIVADDIETTTGNKIPLWILGFLY